MRISIDSPKFSAPLVKWDALEEEIARREQLKEQAAKRASTEEQRNEGYRRQCESLIGFTTYTMPRYRPAPHHRLIATHLERVFRGEVDRLMLLVPPRCGKSELASRRLPAWAIGQDPRIDFISASATKDLARDFGRDVRNIIDGEPYQQVYSTRLAPDSKAADKWHTSEGGSYYAVGVGGTIFGRGGDVILIDDPFASWEDAQSETSRDRVWDWYQGSVYNRLEAGGRLIIVNHRTHEDDLSGRLMAQQAEGGDKWEIIELPAIAREDDILGRAAGEALWPEQFPIEDLERKRANTTERHFSALYNQQPTPVGGSLFKPDNLALLDELPNDVRMWVRGWDFGATTTGDPTAGVRIGLRRNGRYVIYDVRRIRGRPDDVDQLVMETVDLDGPNVLHSLPRDPGQAGVSQQAYFTKLLTGKRFIITPELGSKDTRADPFAAQVNHGNVDIVRAPWNFNYIEELRTFPNGKHDDQVDASSRAFLELIKIAAPLLVTPEMLAKARAARLPPRREIW